jgi:hypothetical protein
MTKKKQKTHTSHSNVNIKKSPILLHEKEGIFIGKLKENINEPEIKSRNMEAYHPHGIHHDRKLKDYLFEFIMLFIAITGGFFMENMRENIAERHKEKEYIIGLIRDIKEDTTTIHRLILSNQRQMKGIDSLLNLLSKPLPSDKLEELYNLTFEFLNNYNGFTARDITMTQLKNSGGLRLIENNSVSDSIIIYYSNIEYYHELNVKMSYKYVDDNMKLEMDFFDFSPYRIKNKKFSISDPGKIRILYNRGFGLYTNIGWDNHWLNEVYEQGASLLRYLNKEYNIKE